ADGKRASGEIVKANRGAELGEGDGEVVVFHLPGQGPLELLPDCPRSVDVPRVARNEQRREEREPLDVIPVGVGDQQVAVAGGPARGRQRLSQAVRPGPAVQHDQRAVVATDLDAGRVAAVAQRGGTRLGHGPTGPPESDIHAVSPYAEGAARTPPR